MKKKCLICEEEFETVAHGGSRKFCFNCSPSYTKNDNNGRAVTITAIRHAVKSQLVKYKGGKCEHCGYNKSLRALEFHHNNPEDKDFAISQSLNKISNFNIQQYYEEVDKCSLLCANCHAEEHDKKLGL